MSEINPTGPPISPWQRIRRVVLTLFAMAGWRLEHLSFVWVAGGLATLGLAHVLMERNDWRLTVPYFLFTLVFYYAGNAFVLLSDIPRRMVERYGEERAFRKYETLSGLMFLNQGVGVGCMATLHMPSWENLVPTPIVLGAGIALFVVGLLVKLWATLTVGVDVYYFRDMFLRRPLPSASLGGPYRFLSNPMYSVGQFQGYGYALLYGSVPGLVAAGAGHMLIYVFYLVAERPFVKRHYQVA